MGAHTEDRSLFAREAFPTFFDAPGFDDRACKDVDVQVFFPDRGHHSVAALAKRTCERCPIKVRCREWALSRPWADVHGVWGGLTQQERRARQNEGKEECPRCGRYIAVRQGQRVVHHSAPKRVCA